MYARALAAENQRQTGSLSDRFKELPKSHQSLVLWIETLLFISATDPDDKRLAGRTMGFIFKAMSFTKFEDFYNALKGVAWMDGNSERDLVNLWTEANTTKRTPI